MPDRIALVTGAGVGIGKAAALHLARDGWSIVLAGRRRDVLEQAAAELPSGTRSLVVPTDVTKPDDVAALFSATAKAFGRLDLLFNNAGLNVPKPIEDMSIEEWDRVVSTNLTGSFLCARQAVLMMKDQAPKGGRIINNGSVSAHTPRPNQPAYSATKHAITGLTKALALDCRKHDIAISQIDIGNAATEMTNRIRAGVMQANGTILAEPSIDVMEVGRAVAYMASLPLEANILFMTLKATKMPFEGRG